MLSETPLPGEQAAGARPVQSNLHDDWIGLGKQYPANQTLPGCYDKPDN